MNVLRTIFSKTKSISKFCPTKIKRKYFKQIFKKVVKSIFK